MINKIRITNFRSFEDSKELSFGNLNLFVGPNNSGKSSLLYSILLLKQTLLDKDPSLRLVTAGPYVNLGSYLDLVRAGSSSTDISILFELDHKAIKATEVFDFRHLKQQSLRPFNHFEFTFGFDTITNSISVRSFQLSDTSSKDVLSGTKIDGEWKISGLPENLLPHVRPSFEHFLPNFQGHGKRPSDKIAAAAMDLIFSSRIRTAALSDFFEKMLYVGPIRNLIPRYGFMGTQSYSELNPSGQNLMRVLSSRKLKGRERKTLMEQLNYWLDTKFKVLSNVRIEDIDAAKTIKAIVADDPRGDKHINLAAMGTGLSQLVPVIVQTVLTPPGGTLLIEQPEIHLHPKAQAALGDLFVTYAKQRRQLIVETHSEHLLLRIRRRIAEGQIDANDVRIFFVDKNKSHTRVRQLRLDNKGHFAQWPAGFFEEGYREAMAIAMAQVEKNSK